MNRARQENEIQGAFKANKGFWAADPHRICHTTSATLPLMWSEGCMLIRFSLHLCPLPCISPHASLIHNTLKCQRCLADYRVRSGFVERYFRHDYDSCSQRLSLGMPSGRHEVCLAEFHTQLFFLHLHQDDCILPPITRLSRDIVSLGSRRIAWRSSDTNEAPANYQLGFG